MTIDQQIDDLLNQVDTLMQELIKNKMPCEELIKKVLLRLGSHAYCNFVSSVSVEAFIDPIHHWVHLRRLATPIALDGRNTESLSWVTIEVDCEYWWSASYAKQLIVVQALPKLIEKVLEQVKQECVVAPANIVFDTVQAPKVKHHWWQFWRR